MTPSSEKCACTKFSIIFLNVTAKALRKLTLYLLCLMPLLSQPLTWPAPSISPSMQETTGHEPDVYRFLPRDVAIYRVAMGMAVVGSATAVVYMIRMATGSVPPKRE